MMGVKIVGGLIWPEFSASKEVFEQPGPYEPSSRGPWWIGGVLFGTEVEG